MRALRAVCICRIWSSCSARAAGVSGGAGGNSGPASLSLLKPPSPMWSNTLPRLNRKTSDITIDSATAPNTMIGNALCTTSIVADRGALRYPGRPGLTDQSITAQCSPRPAIPAPGAVRHLLGGIRRMVDFTLTDEQKNLREMAHDFAVKEIRPVAWEYDKDGTWPQDIIEKAWEVGLMNSHIEEEYGGAGAGYLDGCLIEEELSWGCSGIQTSLGCNGLATAPIALGGSEETKKKYLGMLTEAPKLASFCLTEPDAGSDVSGMRTTAVKKGDKYVING